MIDLTFFGFLVLTLASGLSVALAVIALGAATFLAMTLATAAAPRSGRAFGGSTRAVGLLSAAFVMVVALLGIRVGGAGGTDVLPTLALSASLACFAGSASTLLCIGASRGLLMLASASAERRAALASSRATSERALEARTRGYLEGADLAEEVTSSEAQLVRMRGALEALRAAGAALDAKLGSFEPGDERGADPDGPRAPPSSGLVREVMRARDEVARKVDAGERVLVAADEATFRLACSEPWRRLLRRRPREALERLAQGGAPGGADDPTRLAEATATIEGFLGEVRGAHEALEALEARRPPSGPAAGGDGDPLGRASRDLTALEALYRDVLARVDVLRLRLSARAGMSEVESAAGAVSESTAERDEAEDLHELVREVVRAEEAVGAIPDDDDDRALAKALAGGTRALGQGDAVSLENLARALREIG
jgi:hypothetical protein